MVTLTFYHAVGSPLIAKVQTDVVYKGITLPLGVIEELLLENWEMVGEVALV